MSLYLRPDLLGEGFSDKELRRLRRSGELGTIRPGAYVHGPPPDDLVASHLLRVRAAMEHLSGEAVVSHVSAAILHRLPLWGLGLGRVHVTRGGRCRGGRRGSLVHVRTATLDPAEIVAVGSLPVTSIERTVVDIARSVPFTPAVVVADGALARSTTDVGRAWEILAEMRRWPGARAAKRVLDFADGRSGSVGESRSRVALAAAGIPMPVLQWQVRSTTGAVFDVDFGWPALRAVGEFDGKIKYGRLLRPGEEPGDAVFREKVREDEIRDVDLGVVRWTWQEIDTFAVVAERLRRRFRYG